MPIDGLGRLDLAVAQLVSDLHIAWLVPRFAGQSAGQFADLCVLLWAPPRPVGRGPLLRGADRTANEMTRGIPARREPLPISHRHCVIYRAALIERIVNAGYRWRAGPGIGRIGGMTSEPHRQAIGSLRAVALDAPDIDLLATFYEQFAGWRRVPDDDEDDLSLIHI